VLPKFLLRFLVAFVLSTSASSGKADTQTPSLLSEYTHTAWGSLQGAPVRVHNIVQTTDGWLWMTSDLGLYRFDGIKFERVDAVYGTRLHYPGVFRMAAGKDGALWIGYASSGISVFRKDRSRTFTTFIDSHGLQKQMIRIQDIQVAPDGTVWATSGLGTIRLRPGAEHFEMQGENAGLPETRTPGMHVARDGTQWVATFDGLFFRRPDQERFALASKNPRLFKPTEGPDGTVWAGRFDLADAKIRIPPFATNEVPKVEAVKSPDLHFDRDGYAWVFQVNAVERRKLPLVPAAAEQRFTREQGLSGIFPRVFFQDREGNVWIATGEGIDSFRRNRFFSPPALNMLSASSIARGPGDTMWSSNFITQKAYRVKDTGEISELAAEPFTASCRAPDGAIWTASAHTVRRSAPDGMVTVTPLPERVRGADVQAMLQDEAGVLWVSISDKPGLFQLDHGKWIWDSSVNDMLPNDIVTMTADRRGVIWMGHTGNLVSLVMRHAGKITVRQLNAAAGLKVGKVQALHEDHESMWVGGQQGVALYRNGRFAALRGTGGEAFLGTSGIARLQNGDLWLNGLLGIYRIDAAALARWLRDSTRPVDFERFDAFDGAPGYANQDIPLPSLAQASDGKLWFATTKAMVVIDPLHIPRNTFAPPVVIRALTANDKVYDVETRAGLTLPEGTKRFQISFAALSLLAPERVRFRYRLSGIEQAWRESADRREVSYENLGPGNYRFELTAANEDRAWNQHPATLDIQIRPAFVETSSFLLLLLFAAVLALCMAYMLRVHYLRRRMQERYQLQLDERLRIARSLHDTLLQSVQGLLLSFNSYLRHVPENSRERGKLEKTIDLGWDVVKQGRYQIMSLRVSTADELRFALEPYGKDLAENGMFEFDIRTVGKVRPLRMEINEEFGTIGREALFNAARYANACHIAVELDYDKDAFTMRIRDDGCGLDAVVAELGYRPGHWGLQGMRERAEAIGASFQLESQPGNGTRVTISLPAKQAYTAPHFMPRWLFAQ
jgi:signal transduction histidine kinase